MDVELAPIASLRPDPDNPRRMKRHEAEALQRSLQTYGAVEPAVVNKDGTIIGGHMRVAAAKQLGWSDFPIHRVDLDEEKAKALGLALNRIDGEWDEDKLAEVIYGLSENGGDDVLALTGFDSGQVDALLASVAGEQEIPDPIDPPEDPVTKLGDLWTLGEHRLLCGDATSAGDLDALLEGEVVDLVLTDPPYGVEVGEISNLRGSRQWDAMAGDGLDEDALEALLTTSLGLACERSRAGAPLYMFHAESRGLTAHTAFRAAGWRLAQGLVWRKDRLVIGRSDYQSQHEPILYGWKPGAAHRWYGGRKHTTSVDLERLEDLGDAELRQLVRSLVDAQPGTLIDFERPQSSDQHPTMKPVGLIEKLMLNSSKRGGVVLDPFGGAGSALLAAEAQGRRARLLELDPGYCDVIIARWQQMTGGEATK